MINYDPPLIHIFNPETDYALADFSPRYTPPAEVMKLRRQLALAPIDYAGAGDAILLLDAPDETSKPIVWPGLEIITLAEVKDYLDTHPGARFSPWGWNPMLRQQLAGAGVDADLLPDDQRLSIIRKLSHRRTAILFNRFLNEELNQFENSPRTISPLPIEFTSVEKALEWERLNHPVFFKAPWSSSGRGILFTDDLDTATHIEPWIRGIIRRQGSVTGETSFNKVIDFATEWKVKHMTERVDGEKLSIDFLGVSVFETSRRGKYHSNLPDTQENLLKIIKEKAPDFNTDFIQAQRRALMRLLSEIPGNETYEGFVGIDMMANENGRIRGGVELNFRRTMGIPIPRILIIGTGNVGRHLHRAFHHKGVDVRMVSGRSPRFTAAECYIIAVKDECVAEVAARIKPVSPGVIVTHTSGSVPLDELKNHLPDGTKCGVFYPLQTFTRGVDMDYTRIPFLIEGSDSISTRRLIQYARMISDNVREADSAQRGLYHIAAVLTCNFANHLCTLADEFLSAHGEDFNVLLPLLEQTVSKFRHTPPASAQTGPAVRGDDRIISAHLEKLSEFPDTAEIYRYITGSIKSHQNKPNQTPAESVSIKEK
ncbi:MAG: DUF2520 domain-containing protein [Muribaculaceae bacterium]|nr:DUF2520 domain-containing protein [Muribaculaceae bacterium]